MMKKITFDEAKRRYVHRFTMEYIPGWALVQRNDGTYYAPQYRSDKEWYELTVFPPNEMCYKNNCYSACQTWPLGKFLNKPYEI